MPKLIDHKRRRIEITEAAWRVLTRDGVGAVSVRNVAAEAGVATASLRRAFPTQASLLAACLLLVRDRVTARVRALPETSDPIGMALAALAETLPLDDRRRIEMHAYLTLGTAALADPTLRVTYRQVSDELAGLCSRIVAGLAPAQSGADRDREAAHLYGLLDGLALHTLHGDEPAQAVRVLHAHLTQLAGSPTRPSRPASAPPGNSTLNAMHPALMPNARPC